MSEFLTRPTGAQLLDEARTPQGVAAAMVDNTQRPGDLRMPPTGDLIISQVRSRPFHVTADLGAGRVARNVCPGEFALIAPGVPHVGAWRAPHICVRWEFLPSWRVPVWSWTSMNLWSLVRCTPICSRIR
nr:hypothetical protein [Thioalkalivibrio sp. ALJ24]